MPADVRRIWDACGRAFDLYTTAADSFSDNIERPAIERLVGELDGKRVLDLGCGSGTYSLRFAERGANVTAVDLSPVMIELAREKARDRAVSLNFDVADISKPLGFPASQFDLVFTATVLHYVENIDSFMREARRVLVPGGRLVASVLHPAATARFPLAGPADAADRDLWETRYFDSTARSIETPWLGFGDVSNEGRRIISYHHTLAEYFGAISRAGFVITQLLEPAPTAEFLDKNAARYLEATRLPIYLIFGAEN